MVEEINLADLPEFVKEKSELRQEIFPLGDGSKRPLQEINLADLREFVNEKLGLGSRIGGLKDGRRKLRIPASVVFESVLYGTLMGLESLLAIDEFLKHADLGTEIGFDRGPLVSDSTMVRSLSTMDREEVHVPVRLVAHATLQMALSAGEPLLLGPRAVVAIDMSTLAGRKAVVARYVAPRFEVTLDYEMVDPGENEVTAAKRLFGRLVQEFRHDFDTVVVDGLYTQWFIELARDQKPKIDVVMKTREKPVAEDPAQPEALVILRQAKEWIQVHQRYGLAVAQPKSGVDADGYKAYECIDTGLQGDDVLSAPVRVIRVHDRRLKGKKEQSQYWLVTTLEAIKAAVELIRYIARRRWGIENGAFRTASQNHKAKRKGTQKGKAAEVRVGIVLLAETILRVYTWWKEHEWGSVRSRRASWQSVQKLLMRSVPALKKVRGVKPVGQPHWGLQGLRQRVLRPTGTDTG